MIHLALLADAALLLVLLRMVWIGADQSCPREFFFLLSLLCYALLSFAEDFPAWGHASLAFFALPMLLQKVPGARYQVSGAIAAAVIICAAIFGRSAMAAWGGTPAAHWGLLGALLELAASAVLLLQCALVPSAAEGPASNHVLRLRFFIGAHLLLVDGSAFTGVPFPATVFAATLLWLITAATLAPTPDAMVNPAKLALSPQVAGCRLQVAARSENPRG